MFNALRRRLSFSPWVVVCAVGNGLSRAYALAMVLVLCHAGYLAGTYLLAFVFRPAHAPERLLSGAGGESPVSSNGAEARAPLARFHRTGPRFQSQSASGCTLSGCHDSVAHGDKTKLAAFANFHVGFLACQSCHNETPAGQAGPVWMNPQTGARQEAPVVLRLVNLLATQPQRIQKDAVGLHASILALLREMPPIRPQNADLEELKVKLESYEPGSPLWRTAVEHLRAELPRHARMYYGVRLISEGQFQLSHDGGRELARLATRYQAVAAASDQGKQLNEQIHTGVLKRANACVACHGEEPGALDFAKAGYPPMRVKTLRQLQLARLIDDFRAGGEFRLPTMTEEPHGK